MKATVSTLLLVAALAAWPAAQTLAEQLQRAIFTEETLGNRDEAIRIYRQILEAPAVPRLIAQDAERRLARLTAPQVTGGAGFKGAPGEQLMVFQPKPLGAAEQGRYRHFMTGLTFEAPPGWTVSETYPSSDFGEAVTLTEEATKRLIHVWMIKEETPVSEVATRIKGSTAEKVRQRHSGYNIPGMLDPRTYSILESTVQATLINGQHAIVAIGSYRGVPPERVFDGTITPSPTNVQDMNEYMTWIQTPQTRAFFHARVPVGDLSQLRPSFDQLVQSAVIP